MNKKTILLAGLCAMVATAGAQVTIDIDVNQRGAKISPTH